MQSGPGLQPSPGMPAGNPIPCMVTFRTQWPYRITALGTLTVVLGDAPGADGRRNVLTNTGFIRYKGTHRRLPHQEDMLLLPTHVVGLFLPIPPRGWASDMKHRVRIAGLIVPLILIVSPFAAERPARAQDQTPAAPALAEDASFETEESSEAAGASSDDHAARRSQPSHVSGPDEEAEEIGWMTNVDHFFREYLVKPLDKLLFFDFWTPRWLRTGIPSKAEATDPDCPYEYVFAETWPDRQAIVLLRRVTSDSASGAADQASLTEIVVGREGPVWLRFLGDDVRVQVDNHLPSVVTYPGDDKSQRFLALHAWAADQVPVVIRCPDWNAEIETGQSVPLVVFWLFAGAIFFTIRMRFINIRGFWHAIRVTKGDYDDPEHAGEVSHFQALASALSATVGLGNIAGVAIAVATGGPGATFWLILAGLLGMSTKFSECSLGQMYRKVDPDGTVSGGPMHYLRDGLREIGLPRTGLVLATLFAVVCMGGSFGGGCVFQVSQSLELIRAELVRYDVGLLEHYPWIYGLAMGFLVAIVIIGGIRRIAATAEKIVPLMCGVYVAASLYILVVNHSLILPALALIVKSAFTPEAMYGGFLGVMVIGIRRAAFSNEAGLGSASIAHAAAKTDEPISEGIVALLEPFIDTVVVCTMTGLVVVITGVYNNPSFEDFIANDKGAPLTAEAFRTAMPWFPWILAGAVCLFAYSTLITWSYYGERCWSHLFGRRTALVYKLIFLGFVLVGSIVTASNLLSFADLMILSMAFPNILGVALLSGKIRRSLDDYWRRYKAGELEPKPNR